MANIGGLPNNFVNETTIALKKRKREENLKNWKWEDEEQVEDVNAHGISVNTIVSSSFTATEDIENDASVEDAKVENYQVDESKVDEVVVSEPQVDEFHVDNV
ncbi:hypothetical protein Tco_0745409 [Tanacetum coccineum]